MNKALKIFAALSISLLLIGCKESTKVGAVAPHKVMGGFMYTTLLVDTKDTEVFQKLDGLYEYGNIEFLSAVVQVVRPKFNLSTPYKKMANGKYDLTQWDPEFFAHLEKVVSWCESHDVLLQITLFNEPTARNDKMLPAYSGDNIQGFKGDFPSCVRKTPTGAWADICESLIAKMVPYINRSGAVLFLLEGSGSAEFEIWCYNIAKNYGLSPNVYVITNDGLPGAIKSPHVHSVAAAKSATKPGSYLSTDGLYSETATQLNEMLSYSVQKRGAAFESFANGFLSGYFNLDNNGNPVGGQVSKEKRVRPTMAKLSRGKMAQLVVTMGKY